MSALVRLARRVRSLDRDEATFRAAEQARRIVERASYLTGGARWRPHRLERLLDRAVVPGSVITALTEKRPAEAHERLREHFVTRPERFVLPPLARERLPAAIRDRFPEAAMDATARADRLVAGRYDLLGYRDLDFGADPDWHFDPVHDRRAPRRLWTTVPYLDPSLGDHKIIWELNRHQHWLALGRAYWLAGTPQYRRLCLSQLASWLRDNPPLVGINWASMLELAFRSISWIWALHFFAFSGEEPSDSPWMLDLLSGLHRQLEHVRGHLSRYFSPNTHYTGEALALYVAGRALPELRASRTWERVGRDVLIDQAGRQIGRDGGHLERSGHYHRYTLEFYLFALAIARVTGDPAERAFADTSLKLARFARTLADDRGRLAQLGDDDGGSLTPICRRDPRDLRDSLAVAAILLARPDLAVDRVAEEAYWLTAFIPATELADRVHAIDARSPWSPQSAALDDTGYCVSRGPGGDHLILDAGPHAFLNGGHAHADPLALTLTIGGDPLFIDPGTATYTMDPALRDRFRSAEMHNTLVIDARPPCEPAGPFHWRSRADGRLHRWRSNHAFDFIDASHSGYDGTTHRRLVFAAPGRCWVIADLVLGDGRHQAAAHWHLDPAWRVDRTESCVMRALNPAGRLVWIAMPRAQVEIVRGGDTLGWCSPVYGAVVPATALRAEMAAGAPFAIVTAILPHRGATHDRHPPGVDLAPVWTEAGTTRAHVAVRTLHDGVASVTLFVLPADPAPERASWRVAGLETDALALHYEAGVDGVTRRVAMVEGSFVRRTGGDGFSLELPRPAADASAAIRDGVAIVTSSCALDRVRVRTDRGQLGVELDRSLGSSDPPASAAGSGRRT